MDISQYPPDYLVNTCSSLINKYIRFDLGEERSKIDRGWVERQLLQQYVQSVESGQDFDDASIEAKVYNSAIRKIYIMYIEAKRYQKIEDYNEYASVETTKKKELRFYREPIEII